MTVTTVARQARQRQRLNEPLPRAFLLRVGGLPIQAATALRFDRTAAWADALLAQERELAATREPTTELLEAAVGQNLSDVPLRRRLINLRRELYNLRLPQGDEPLAGLAEVLGADGIRQMQRVMTILHHHRQAVASGRRILETELAERRARLRGVADEPDLRAGILLASPSLDRYLPTYLAASGALGKRARRIERSLLEYLFRTACKTSPFSTLTTVCPGSFGDAGGAAVTLPLSGAAKRSAARLNHAVLTRISAALQADEEIRPELPVCATPGWHVDGDRVRYLRRQRSISDDGDAPVAVDQVHEAVFYLPAGRLLADVLDALADGRRVPLGALSRQLSRGGARPPEQVDEYLHLLVRIGLLVVPNLAIDIHLPDPVTGYRQGLAQLSLPWARQLSARLEQVTSLVRAYPDRSVPQRRQTVEDIRGELRRAHAELGRPDEPMPRTILYEDATIDRADAVADRRLWTDTIMPQLRQVTRILPMFDANLPRRLVTKGFFRARYGVGGRCEDVLTFAHKFQRDFFTDYWKRQLRRRPYDDENRCLPQENWFRLPEITALDSARAELAHRIGTAYRSLPPGASELVIDQELLTAVAAQLPAGGRMDPLDPRSFFLQITDGADPLVAINKVYSGLTLMFSRFSHLFSGTDLVTQLRAELADIQPAGAVFAELKGGYDATNLNVHPVMTPYELVCPGELSFRAADEQIPVEDLVIEHDQVTDRICLRSRRLDVEVIPLYLGFLMPIALPEVQQVLLNFSYTSMAQLDLWGGAAIPLPEDTIAGYPRVRYGNLVLQRRMWKLPPERLPEPDPSLADHERFLQWARWRSEHGIPRRVFVTPDSARSYRSDDDPGGGGGEWTRGEYKPLYVDFDSHFSLQLLEASGRQAKGRLVMTEMLPDVDQLVVRDGERSYVSELIVELNGPPANGR